MEIICEKRPIDEIPVCRNNGKCGDNCEFTS